MSGVEEESDLDDDISSILYTLYASLVAGGGLLLIFEGLRGRNNRMCRSLYRQRHSLRYRKLNPRLRRITVPPYPRGFLAWIPAIVRMSDQEFLCQVGFDGFVTLRFIRLCKRICFCAAFLGLVVLVPIYVQGIDSRRGSVYYTTMKNLENGDIRLWAPVVMAYFFTFFTMHTLRQEHHWFMHERNTWLANGDIGIDRQTSYTVMVDRIPKAFRSPAMLQRFFNTLFPGTVHSATVCLRLGDLSSLQAQRNRALQELEKATILKQAKGINPTVGGGCCSCSDGKDAMDYYAQQVAELNQRLRPLQDSKLTAARAVEELKRDELKKLGGDLENMALYFVDQLQTGGKVTNSEPVQELWMAEEGGATTQAGDEPERRGSSASKGMGKSGLRSNMETLLNRLKPNKPRAATLQMAEAEEVLQKKKEAFLYEDMLKMRQLSRLYDQDAERHQHRQLQQHSRSHLLSADMALCMLSSSKDLSEAEEGHPASPQVNYGARRRAQSAHDIHTPVDSPSFGPMPKGTPKGTPNGDGESSFLFDPPASLTDQKGRRLSAFFRDEQSEVLESIAEAGAEGIAKLAQGNSGHAQEGKDSEEAGLHEVEVEMEVECGRRGHRSSSSSVHSQCSVNFYSVDDQRPSITDIVSPVVTKFKGGITDLSVLAKEQAGNIKANLGASVNEVSEAVKVLVMGSMSGTGYVTFNTMAARASAVQMLITSTPGSFEVRAAPEARDLLWNNVTKHVLQIETRKNLMNAIVLMGIVFWSVVVSTIQALSSVETLSRVFPDLESMLVRSPQLAQFIRVYLPVLLVLILLNNIYFILKGMAKHFEGYKSASEVERAVVSRYFYFQLANIYVTVTAGSIFKALGDIIANPASVLSLLGETLPRVAVYFTNLIIVKVVAGLMLELCFGGRPLKFWRILCIEIFTDPKLRTLEGRTRGVFEPSEPWYGRFFSDFLLVMMVVFTYQVIAPMVCVAGVIYFVLAEVIYKYQLVHCFWPLYESGGIYFYKLFKQVVVGEVAGLITLIGYMSIRDGLRQVPALLPLPILVLYIGMQWTREGSQRSDILSLDKAVLVDKDEELSTKKGEEPIWESFDKQAYMQPELKDAQPLVHCYNLASMPGEDPSFPQEVDSDVDCEQELHLDGEGNVTFFGNPMMVAKGEQRRRPSRRRPSRRRSRVEMDMSPRRKQSKLTAGHTSTPKLSDVEIGREGGG
ncbi:unnamed protein product [Chrysoparadoxa australica]